MISRLWMAALAAALLVPLMARAETDKKTERTWKAKCASCHGVDGKGKTDQGEKMAVGDYTDAAWQKSKTDAELKGAISDGLKRDKAGKKQEMDAYKDKLSAEEIDKLVAHVRALK